MNIHPQAPIEAPARVAGIALGATLGNRQATLEEAIRHLDGSHGCTVLRVSSWFETEPVGGPAGQPPFLNGALLALTTLQPLDLMANLLRIEASLGRVRKEKDGPRTLDLDLVFLDGLVLDWPDLQLPHPRFPERRFVVAPLAQIAPGWRHPVTGTTITAMLGRLDGMRITNSHPGGELLGTTAVVLGASKGIGKAIAEELARAGAQVICHGRDATLLEATCRFCRLWGVKSWPICLDLRTPGAALALVNKAEEIGGPADIWVQNAGADILTGDGPGWSLDEKLRSLFEVDARGTLEGCRAVGERMRRRGKGAIITMGWDQADCGMAGDSGQLFGLIKGGVMALTKSLAASLSPEVRVNGVAPGWVRTSWGENASETWQKRAIAETLLGRWGTPSDIAQAVRFLAGPQSGWITGQILRVNGGATR